MKYMVYAFFLVLPFGNIPIFGHIYPIDIPLILALLLIPFSSKANLVKIMPLDILVIGYAFFSLLSVIVDLSSIYEGARYYRLMVMTPVLIYVVIRLSGFTTEELRKGLFFMLPGIIWQGILLLKYYIVFGLRPVNVEGATSTITLSILLCIGLAILLFGFVGKLKPVVQVVRYGLVLFFFVVLVICFTRTTLVSFVLMVPFVPFIWKSTVRRSLVGRGMFSLLTFMLVLILSGSIIFSDAKVQEDTKDIQNTADRLFNVDMYVRDIRDRIAFWGGITAHALENPIFGSGGASFTVGKSAGTVFHLGSSHNVLVSTIVTSGLFGLLILLLIIYFLYKSLTKLSIGGASTDAVGKVMMISVTIMILVAITNDLTGGRVFIWFMLISFVSRLLVNDLHLKSNEATTVVDESIKTESDLIIENYSGVRLRK